MKNESRKTSLINSFKWTVFLKVMDGKQLGTWEEFKMFEQIFGTHYFTSKLFKQSI